MRLGVRGKLFASSVGLVVAVVLVGGLVLEGRLRRDLLERSEVRLEHLAHAAAQLLQQSTEPNLDPIADRVARASDVRVTAIDAGGVVVADSERDGAALQEMENHGGRPEIREAFDSGRGSAMRYSTTVGAELLYVAVRYEIGGAPMVVRLAEPVSDVEASVSQVRHTLWGVGLIALLATAVLAALVSHWFTRTVRNLVDSARALAAGRADVRVELASSDELGGLAGSINRLADELDRVVRELAEERGRLAAVLAGMGEGLIALDADRRITLANPASLAILDTTDAEGRSLLELMRAPDLVDALAGTEARTIELSVSRVGEPLKLQARLSPQEGGGWVIVLHDVTELRRLERIRRDFVANVSHELRTPVSVISANSETLDEGAIDEPEMARKLLGAIRRNAERLTNLISDLLDLSKIEAGRYRLDSETVDVAARVELVIEQLSGRIEEREATVSVDVGAGIQIRGDGDAVQQIIVNYVDNALKYAFSPARIVIRAFARDDMVTIEVEDDGPGIETKLHARVFERFYRVDPGRSREIGGTGLGLAIVRHLAESMGGTVGVRNAKPRGTIFWARLPGSAKSAASSPAT